MSGKSGRMTISFSKRLELYERMKTFCKKEGEFAVYEPGWSDARLANMLGVTPPIIRNLREEMFGDVKRTPKEKGESRLNKLVIRVDTLEKRICELEKGLGVTS